MSLNKPYSKIILILVTVIAAIAMLYPTYEANKLEKIHQHYINQAKQAKTSADSLAILEKFQKEYGEALQKAKNAQLKLGLDLRGGMYVTLEVDVPKLIEETASNQKTDEIFQEVIAATRNEAKSSEEDVIDIFLKHFNNIARPKGRTLINYFDFGNARDWNDEKVIEKLRQDQKQAIDQALEVLRQRIDQYGVAEPNIQKQGSARILMELPGVSNVAQMRDLLQTTARLEFNLVRNNKQIVEFFYRVDQYLSKRKIQTTTDTTILKKDTTQVAQANENKATKGKQNTKTDTNKVTTDTTKVAKDTTKADTTDPYAGLPQEEATRRYLEDHPFTRLFTTYYVPQQKNAQLVPIYYTVNQFPEGEYIFKIIQDSIPKFKEILNRPEIKAMMPAGLKIAFDAKPDPRFEKQGIKVIDFYSLKKEPELTGEVIVDALATYDPSNNLPIVTMAMNSEGADKWAKITGANLQKRIAIVLDDRVYSAPTVQTKITGGNSQITGMANAEEARLLEIVLKAGALKAPVQIIEERVVGPSLGEDSIRNGLMASLIAAALVLLFMFVYYSIGGLYADIAVIINILLLIGVLASLGGTLTLPGIAGIILTLGMAVDANVLIYERIREELRKGRTLKSAIDEGFGKALSAILDSNITTFITGLILFYLGTGPIQGFALTLMIGIIGTLFTAIVLTRAMIEVTLQLGAERISFGETKLKTTK